MPKGSGGKLAQFGSCWAGLDSRLRSVGILRPGRYLSVSPRFLLGSSSSSYFSALRSGCVVGYYYYLPYFTLTHFYVCYLRYLTYLHKSLSTGQATYIEILMSMFWSLWTLLLLLLLLVYFSVLMIVIGRRVYVHVHALAPPSTNPLGGAKNAVKSGRTTMYGATFGHADNGECMHTPMTNDFDRLVPGGHFS